MKKYLLTAGLLALMSSKTYACADYDPEYEYFNLFTQSIIKDKSYLPFLHTLTNRFYGHEHFEIPDENIEDWQKFFGKSLTYAETKVLVEKMPMQELNAFKKGNKSNLLLAKLGSYEKYKEAIDYLIEAKYIEPFMRINFVENPDSFYGVQDETAKNATQLNYEKTVAALKSLYDAAKIPEIKLRYGYQLVRFNHYTRNYQKSTEAFETFVAPLKLKSAPYYMALDQFAGAQRGLGLGADANYNFFQVFMKSKSRKESAFISMKLSDSASFDNLMKRAQTPEEKNMAHFLLGYEDFGNPVPMMEKMYEIDPNSEILKVLAARSINELERNYLPSYYSSSDTDSPDKTTSVTTGNAEKEEAGIWQKIKNFFSNLFSSEEKNKDEKSSEKSDEQLINDPNRTPKFTKQLYNWSDQKSVDFAKDFKNITAKIKEKSNDEFWEISDAYLAFLMKDYEGSKKTLDQIKTTNQEYIKEITRMKMLNDIAGQPRIDAAFEDHLFNDYHDFFVESIPDMKTDSLEENFYNPRNATASTKEFLRDILANRYFIQGEKGKSFLMNNNLENLRSNPNLELTKDLEAFFKKKNKTSFESEIIAKNKGAIEPDEFFNDIYGDLAMKSGQFKNAVQYYSEAKKYASADNSDSVGKTGNGNSSSQYNAQENYISSLIFGHNVWESYQSDEKVSMKAENFAHQFPIVKDSMTKLQVAVAALTLQKTGTGKDEMGAKANQLLGNLLYNTSILGYYRETYVMDYDAYNGGNNNFSSRVNPFQYYYKNYYRNSFILADNYDLTLSYYKKALENSTDREQKARVLFQMASAEQGKYYQYEADHYKPTNYDDVDWSKQQDEYELNLVKIKNEKYRSSFATLKTDYADTQISKSLQGSCSYYAYFLTK